MATVHGYVRGSTDRQQLTLEAQEERIRRACAYKEVLRDLPLKLWVDPAISGKKKLQDRVGGRRLLSHLEEGDHVVFCKLDRGFRSASDAIVTIEGWLAAGVRVHFLDYDVDTGTPTGKLMLTILAGVAEMERSLISERTREALAHKRGVLQEPCGRAPFLHKYGPGDQGCRPLVLIEHDLEQAKFIYAWKRQGYSWGQIVTHLVQSNVKRENGATWGILTCRKAYAFVARLPEDQRNHQGPQGGDDTCRHETTP